jgi:hypothetical protein
MHGVVDRKPDWTDQEIEKAKHWWAEGKSGAEIARELVSVAGVMRSRCSVIAKLHRLGVAGHRVAQPKMRRGPSAPVQPRRQAAFRPKVVVSDDDVPSTGGGFRLAAIRQGPVERLAPTPPPLDPDISHGGFTLVELENGQCRMPIGVRGGQDVFCGCRCERARRGRFESFCPGHKLKVVDARASARQPVRDPDPLRVPQARIDRYRIGRRDHAW